MITSYNKKYKEKRSSILKGYTPGLNLVDVLENALFVYMFSYMCLS